MVKRKHVPRGPNKPKPFDEHRKLVSRKEAAIMLGRHVDTLKKLEVRRGGSLEVVRLNGPTSHVFYRIADIDALVSTMETADEPQDTKGPDT